MKITIGITTFNRKNYLIKLKQSLYLSEDINSCNIRIYDDCSTEYGIKELVHLFPHAHQIIRRDQNMGPYGNLRQMYLDFLATNDDILVTMDSDLICRPDWINFTKKYFYQTKGIMSLYNSILHQSTKNIIINGIEFLEKEHIGAAGSIMSREIIQEIINNLPSSESFDWAWSDLLRKKGIPILVPRESYFQHIGALGHFNDGIKTVEYALNFDPIHDTNKKIIAEYQNEIINIRQNHS